MTGIKAHTIRIWERRYNLIEPGRTDTNIRFYSDDDLKKLLNVSILNQKGIKISRIAEMDDFQIRDRVLDFCTDSQSGSMVAGNLMLSMLEFDEARFSATLSESVIQIGFEATVEDVLIPFMGRMGLLWQAGAINISQEHFISNLIRQKLQVAINNEVHKSSAHRGSIVFFAPEDELHDAVLLFYSFIARKEGFEVLYLGGMTPIADLAEVFSVRPYDAMFFTLSCQRRRNSVAEVIASVEAVSKGMPVFAAGSSLKEYNHNIPRNFTICHSALCLKQKLTSIVS